MDGRRQLAVFRHAMTKKGEARGRGSHLSAEGVGLARRVGAAIGVFERVIVTPVPRTMETALAMGFAVDDVVEPVCGYVAGEFEHHAQWEWDQPYVRFAEMIGRRGKLAGPAAVDAARWRAVVAALPPGGRALVISHGGSIEPVAVACLPAADHAAWGAPLSHCDGVVLTEDGGAFVEVELRRAAVLVGAR